jgi:3-phenylpropionate/cinnamic acid dioxygenase small subunit
MKQKIQDRLDVQALSVRYANALDREDLEAWLDTWAEGGVWEGAAGRYVGLAELAKLPGDLGPRVQGKRHVMSNFVVTGDGDELRQQCYMLIFEKGSAQGLIATGVYDDVVKRINGQWKFAHRKLELNFKLANISDKI